MSSVNEKERIAKIDLNNFHKYCKVDYSMFDSIPKDEMNKIIKEIKKGGFRFKR